MKTAPQKHKVYAAPEAKTDCGFIQTHKRRLKKAIAAQAGLDREQYHQDHLTGILKCFFLIMIKLGSPNTIFNMLAHCTVLLSITEG